MSLSLQAFKNSAFWQPFARRYQRSGLKARVYSRSLVPPVPSISESSLYERWRLNARPVVEPPPFTPPVDVPHGPMPPEDAAFLARLIAALAPASLFEFGTNWGVSTGLMAANTPPHACLRTLDVCRDMFSAEQLAADPELAMILPREHTGWHYRQHPLLRSKVEQIFADSLAYEMPAEPKHDFILVDACHQLEYVRKDTQNALRGLAPGGVLMWHDFYPDVSSWTDVFRFVSGFAKTHPRVIHITGTHIALWRAPATRHESAQ